jgi:hypothetical protein
MIFITMEDKMEKHFNNAGPMNKDNMYKIDPLKRWDLQEVLDLIKQEKYFILHAPRQTGKTSCMLAVIGIYMDIGYIAVM